jgi:hypothetical protein
LIVGFHWISLFPQVRTQHAPELPEPVAQHPTSESNEGLFLRYRNKAQMAMGKAEKSLWKCMESG